MSTVVRKWRDRYGGSMGESIGGSMQDVAHCRDRRRNVPGSTPKTWAATSIRRIFTHGPRGPPMIFLLALPDGAMQRRASEATPTGACMGPPRKGSIKIPSPLTGDLRECEEDGGSFGLITLVVPMKRLL